MPDFHMPPHGETTFTDDRFLGGRLLLRQPTRGHRLGTDALLLAAAAGHGEGWRGRVADLGSGAGLVGLALARRGSCETVLVERDPVFAACAGENLTRLGLSAISVSTADIFLRRDFLADPRLADQSFDAVATNPPYDQAAGSRRSPSPLKAAAHDLQGGTLSDWLAAAVRLLRDGGRLTLIHRADSLSGVLAALPRRAGAIRLRPVQPRADLPATRILIGATAGSRAGLLILPSFVLHTADGGFTPEAQAVHAGDATIDMG
jgi:tRNA1(Val) A37 N6-methylase TrmN6